MTAKQLQLVPDTPGWKLDRHTISVGKTGLAAARAALQACRNPNSIGADTPITETTRDKFAA